MKKIARAIAAFIAVAILGVGGFALAARSGLLSPSEAELRAKYMLPTSHIVDVDGGPIHYSDEGQGEAIVLVHGTFGNLRMWNDWVKVLGSRYRIVRFDRPPYGLSGPDPKGRYGAEREVEIIENLTAKLGIEKFFLAGNSSGGASVTQYAARHPEQIKGLVVSNIGVKPMTADPNRYAWIMRQSRKISFYLNGWHPKMEWRAVLERNMIHHDKVTDALVTEYTELNNRHDSYMLAQAQRPVAQRPERTPEDLALITAPTLVIWSGSNSERPPHPFADDVMQFLGSKDKALEIVPQCESMMSMDCGPESAAIVATFFERISAAGS